MLIGPYPYSTVHTYIGSMAQEHRLNVIANNLANINTPGFKKDVPVFEGYMVKATRTYFSQGAFEQTGNTLDLALSGPGFFQVETPNGVRYTRNGAFTRDSVGEVVTMQGYPVVGAGVVPENVVDLVVDENGRILADGNEIGRFELVEFEDPKVLAKEGHDMFALKVEGLGGEEATETTMRQGAIERSNINPVTESVAMIDTLRTYEVFQKVIQAFQEADQKSMNEVGRLV